MILIVVKFQVRPESVDGWLQTVDAFTRATRAEDGCLWFEWSRSVDDPAEFVLVEAFRDGEAGGAHVGSDHFKAARSDLPPHLVSTPRVINAQIPDTDWSELGEMAVEG